MFGFYSNCYTKTINCMGEPLNCHINATSPVYSLIENCTIQLLYLQLILHQQTLQYKMQHTYKAKVKLFIVTTHPQYFSKGHTYRACYNIDIVQT